jgi:lipoprotein-anchoring transpeptidase ErfK/SrfK
LTRFFFVWLAAGNPLVMLAQSAAAEAHSLQPEAKSGVTFATKSSEPASYPRAPLSWLETQVALAREGFSCGSMDGVPGAQTTSALLAYQRREGLAMSGMVDGATAEHLRLLVPAFSEMVIVEADLVGLQPIGATWLEKSAQASLAYESVLEMIAERAHASPALVRRLNPLVDWNQVKAGTAISLPLINRRVKGKAAVLHIQLAAHVLEACDATGRVLAHFPVSIARRVEKRPDGQLHVTVIIPNPDYTFNPELFPDSEEAQTLKRNLLLPPGPNNPVGTVWVGLDLPGYGIHGTPNPEAVGRTESHGCFRLANWDAEALADLAWVGLPVMVDL